MPPQRSGDVQVGGCVRHGSTQPPYTDAVHVTLYVLELESVIWCYSIISDGTPANGTAQGGQVVSKVIFIQINSVMNIK